MKKNKILIFSIISFVIILLIALFLALTGDNSRKNKNTASKETNKNSTQEENGISTENFKAHEMEVEAGKIEYYTVCNCITKYLNRTEGNIFIPIEIKKVMESPVEAYQAYGVLATSEKEYISDIYFLTYMDITNKTFEVNEYSNADQIEMKKLDKIEKEKYNTFKYQEATNEYIYTQIFKNMRDLMLTKPEIAYNYLDNSYKSKRFANYKDFEQYIENNREHIKQMEANKYKVNDEGTILTIRDQESNGYQFEMLGTMKYKAKIDNYIVLFEDDILRYQTKFDEEEKVEFCINRWFKMLNSKDYKFAYNCLDEEFRNTKYGSLEKFASYIKDIYISGNDIIVKKIEEQGNVFIAEVAISDQDDEYADKYINVIIRLDEETDFTMSFETE